MKEKFNYEKMQKLMKQKFKNFKKCKTLSRRSLQRCKVKKAKINQIFKQNFQCAKQSKKIMLSMTWFRDI